MSIIVNKKPDLNDIDLDLCHITHLIDEAISLSLEVSHVALDERERKWLNRSTAFSIIARDMLERISASFWDVAKEVAPAEVPQPEPHEAEIAPTVLQTLIERHSNAHKMFNDTYDRADTMSKNFDQAYVEINKRFDEEEEQALKDIAAFRTSTRADEEMKAAYLLNHSGHTYDQDSFVLRAMLTMMAGTGTKVG